MSNDEPTIQDVLDVMKDYSAHVDGQFAEIKSDITTMKSDITTMKSDITTMKSDITTMKSDMVGIKSSMVTKSYLDDKLADLRGDLVVLARKEDTKLKALVDILAEKKVLSVDETKRIFSMEPFPQLAL